MSERESERERKRERVPLRGWRSLWGKMGHEAFWAGDKHRKIVPAQLSRYLPLFISREERKGMREKERERERE
ncbi:hypothetical protein JZ751_006733 [Albula glossodonta]|uniref:Uncharacterized protein n=1 Tax=Albula glossodonta TaxID=121402 RepID=A0A8T2P9W1_9TELE|nr:hypothetical protein JZ751_006733 [Albula glossodonta]